MKMDIIQIWICDEGNMEFYGSEATILTDILGQYLLYYMSNVYGSSTLVYEYIYC